MRARIGEAEPAGDLCVGERSSLLGPLRLREDLRVHAGLDLAGGPPRLAHLHDDRAVVAASRQRRSPCPGAARLHLDVADGLDEHAAISAPRQGRR